MAWSCWDAVSTGLCCVLFCSPSLFIQFVSEGGVEEEFGGRNLSSSIIPTLPIFLFCLQVLYSVISPAGSCSPEVVTGAVTSTHFIAELG